MQYNAVEKNPNWKGGKTVNSEGYVLVKNRSHPYANNNGYVYEHRLVMEKKIKRILEPSEQIHHINGIKNDNRIDNLKLISSASEHKKIHPIIFTKEMKLKMSLSHKNQIPWNKGKRKGVKQCKAVMV